MSAFLLCFAAWSAIALGMDRHHEDALGQEGAVRRLVALRRSGWLLLVLSLWLAAAHPPGGVPASLGVTAWSVALSVAAVAVTATVTWQPRRTPELAGAALLAGLLARALGGGWPGPTLPHPCAEPLGLELAFLFSRPHHIPDSGPLRRAPGHEVQGLFANRVALTPRKTMHAYTPTPYRLHPLVAALLATLCGTALAQTTAPPAAVAQTTPQTLGEVTVQSSADDDGCSPAAASTATKGSAPLRDVPQAVNVVPAQLLRDQGARSMEDALRNVPGVAMSHGDGQRDQVVIRGFTAIADQFVDGVRDDALYFRDLADIERVEVLKGPAAVLYGRGSSGGLINRVTKKPKFGETSGEASLGLGNFDYRRATADVNVGINDTAAFRINAAVEDSGSYRDQQFVKRHNFAPSLALKLAAQTDLLLQYTNARDKRLTDFGIPALNGRPVNVPASTYYGSSNAAQDDTTTSTMQSFAATLNHRFNDDWSVRNVTRLYDYALDRYNTLPGGTTDPVNLTVGRTRSFILRDEKGFFNQTDVTWRNQLGGLQQAWLMGVGLGQQKKRSESVTGGADRVPLFNPGNRPAPAIPAANYNADSSIPSHTTQDTAALYW